ncbi:FAD-binding oxidoreductase [Paenibacillus sp. CC-CFT747]|nr:FAD-binding oxidoreductase [Paenibacillus sp. CC-CFT747]
MKKESTALVVGGGLLGGSIAWELAERGVSVTLLDKGSFGGEASTAAAGMLGAHVETHADGPFLICAGEVCSCTGIGRNGSPGGAG